MGAYRVGVCRTAVTAAIAVLIAVAAGCGNESGAGEGAADGDVGSTGTEPTTTEVPACNEVRRAVAFEIVGALMAVDQEFYDWIADAAAVPQVRPGAAELTHAYQQKGYEVIYFTLAPSTLPIGDVLVGDALNAWLDSNNFARGSRTRLFAPEPDDRIDEKPALGISDELVRERSQGVVTDYAYGNSDDKILAFQTGGVAPDRVFSLGEGAGTNGSTAVPGDDLVAHRASVDALPKVCE